MLRSRPMTPHRLAVIILLLATQLSIQARVARPDTYVELVRKAQERSQAQDWRAAASLWQEAVEINPTVADMWYALGTALLNAGEYRNAIPALEKSRELGTGSVWIVPAYDIARAYGRLGEKKPTLEWLEKALAEGFPARRFEPTTRSRFCAKMRISKSWRTTSTDRRCRGRRGGGPISRFWKQKWRVFTIRRTGRFHNRISSARFARWPTRPTN